jgi:hypothetical protein
MNKNLVAIICALIGAVAIFGAAVIGLIGKNQPGIKIEVPPQTFPSEGSPQPQSVPSNPPDDHRTEYEPRIPRDKINFVRDITMLDGEPQKINQQVVKKWEVRNAGEVIWNNRFLKRMSPHGPGICETDDVIEIPIVKPGQTVEISVKVITPSSPGSCHVEFKIVDNNGIQYFPHLKPLFISVPIEK